MPFVYANARSLIGKPLMGEGECVDLIKGVVPGLIRVSTQAWREGANVLKSTHVTPGTAIATFFHGKFPRQDTGQHAAIYLAPSGNGFWVVEQHRHSGKIVRRRIEIPRGGAARPDGTFPNASNNALAFSIIER